MATAGFPDWQSYSTWRGAPVTIDASNLNPSTSQSSAYLYSSQWQSVLIDAVVTAGSLQVDLQYTDDPTVAVPVWERQRRVNHLDVNTAWREVLPVVGSACRVTVTNNSTGAAATGTVSMTGLNLPATGVKGLVSYNHASVSGLTIFTGQSSNLYLPYISPGDAAVYAYTPSATGTGFSAQVYIIGSDGNTADQITQFAPIQGSSYNRLILPPEQVILTLNNSTGATVHNIKATITGQS